MVTVWLDGGEGERGRALLTLSVLYLAAPALRDCRITMFDVDHPDVRSGAAAAAFDTKLNIETTAQHFEQIASPSRHGILLSILHKAPERAELLLEQASELQLLPLIAMQGECDTKASQQLLPPRYAYDTSLYACFLTTCVQALSSDKARGVNWVQEESAKLLAEWER